jgi:hypothetical protein
MKPEFEEKVENEPKDMLVLGGASRDSKERSLKYAWKDKNGKRTCGGELPLAAVPQAVLFAARTE